MSALTWDVIGERFYETGVDRGVLFPMKDGVYQKGVAWSGLTGVDENPSGGEVSKIYADNIDYLALTSVEEYGCTINAYMSPKEFDACDGSKEIAEGVTIGQQEREHFGFSYRTLIGNETEGTKKGYKIHLVYNCLASPSSRSNSTVNDSPEAQELSREVSTTPALYTPKGNTAHVVINADKLRKAGLLHVVRAIEEVIYGSGEEYPARLPSYDDLMALMSSDYLLDSNGATIYDNKKLPVSSS